MKEMMNDEIRMTNDELPEGWVTTILAEVGVITTGTTPSTKDHSLYGGNTPFVKPGHLDHAAPITYTEQMLSQEGVEQSRLLRAGAVMISCIGNLGKVGIAGVPLVTNQQINSIEFDPSIVDDRFGAFYCRTLKPWMEQESSATTIAILNKGRFSTAPFVLAPLPEQKRIADKLEAVLGRVDACRARLDRVPDLLKRFRQSVLAAATSGQLTEGWRSVEGIGVETQTIHIGEDKFEVPSNWTKATLSNVIDPKRPLCYGVVQPGEEMEGGSLLIRVQDMLGGRINKDGLRTISPKVDAEYKRSRIKAGDLLISVVGTIGRTSIVPADLEANIARAIARIACREGVDSRWINFWLSSQTLQWWLSSSSKEVARKTLNLSDIELAPVAIPPFPEQAEIVRRVEALFAMADRIEARLTIARTQVDRLTPATLAKAFRGELVPQDANDEPAEELLKRIANTKKTAHPKVPTSRKRK